VLPPSTLKAIGSFALCGGFAGAGWWKGKVHSDAVPGAQACCRLYPRERENGALWFLALEEFELAKTHSRKPAFSDTGVWRCPSSDRPSSIPEIAGYVDYGYNLWGISPPSDPSPLGLGGLQRSNAQPVLGSAIIKPADTLALGDGFSGAKGVLQDGAYFLWRTPRLEDYPGSTARSNSRHQGRANVIFCDGHVEALSLRTMFTDDSDSSLQRWNRDHEPHREKLAP
jgi:prepilin-type processing-associated H-X9-DG protein